MLLQVVLIQKTIQRRIAKDMHKLGIFMGNIQHSIHLNPDNVFQIMHTHGRIYWHVHIQSPPAWSQILSPTGFKLPRLSQN